MRSSYLVAVLALASVAVAAATLQPVPGIQIGIGQSFDATKITTMGLQINPLQPVIDLTYCPEDCLSPANATQPGCMYCTYTLPDYPDMVYKVPEQVFVMPYTESNSCYDQHTSENVQDYTNLVGTTVGHSGWFHSWSRTTINFYHELYEQDSSLSLMYKALIWHTITLPTFLAKPSPIFTLGVDALPATYDSAIYQEFIQQYGTHYMDKAHVGGLALLTNYFHSCFLSQYGGQFVYHESGSSFFGIFPLSKHASHSGFNHTSGEFKEWSTVKLKLLGGDSGKYGVLGRNNTLSVADCQAWEDSIKDDMTIIEFSLQPLTTLITDPVKKSNMAQALAEYGVDIAKSNSNLVNSLIPKDPHKVPSWCHYKPPPPEGEAQIVRPDESDDDTGTLPGCPGLPTEADLLANPKFQAMLKAL